MVFVARIFSLAQETTFVEFFRVARHSGETTSAPGLSLTWVAYVVEPRVGI
jgi:hypothetical protein